MKKLLLLLAMTTSAFASSFYMPSPINNGDITIKNDSSYSVLITGAPEYIFNGQPLDFPNIAPHTSYVLKGAVPPNASNTDSALAFSIIYGQPGYSTLDLLDVAYSFSINNNQSIVNLQSAIQSPISPNIPPVETSDNSLYDQVCSTNGNRIVPNYSYQNVCVTFGNQNSSFVINVKNPN